MRQELQGGRRRASIPGKILESGIEDDKRNFTRFFLIRNLIRGSSREEGKRGLSPSDSSRCEQDFHRFPGEECAGSAVQVAERVCPSGY